MNSEQGFFVKVRDDFYMGPYDNLKLARDSARKVSSNLCIYHGILKKISEGIIDDSQLYLVPKIDKS